MVNKIVILGTGGTIAGTSAGTSDVGYNAAQIGIEQLVAAVPALKDLPIECEQVAQIDSKDMTHDVLRVLALRVAHWLDQPDVEAIVVTHGTDTLEETAWFLQTVLQPAKPVVLTCAMRPATALVPDGPQNMLDAVVVARTPGARGVVVVCAGTVHAARDVRKVHTYRLDAFNSGDAGPLGYVEQGALRRLRDWPETGSSSREDSVLTVSAQHVAALLSTAAADWPRVEIVTSHAGADGRLIDLLVADGAKGIVVAATGNGTIHWSMEAALFRAGRAGVAVVRATRCAEGRVISTGNVARAGEAESQLAHAADLTPVKARISLMIALIISPAQPFVA